MYKIIEFESEMEIYKIDCLRQLADYLNSFTDIAIADMDKEWSDLDGYYILSVVIIYYDFDEED